MAGIDLSSFAHPPTAGEPVSIVAKHGEKGEPGYRLKHPGYRTGQKYASGSVGHQTANSKSGDRAELKKFLLFAFGNGQTCPCFFCDTRLNFDTVTKDRVVEGKVGGRYTQGNLIPSCMTCNTSGQDVRFQKGVVWRPKNKKRTARESLALAKKKGLLSEANLAEARMLKRNWNKKTAKDLGITGKEVSGRYYLDANGMLRRRTSTIDEPGDIIGPGRKSHGRRGNRVIKGDVPPEFTIVVAATTYQTPGVDDVVLGPLTYRTARDGTKFYTVLIADPNSPSKDQDYFEVEVQPQSITDVEGEMAEMAKRDVSTEERESLAGKGKALPDGSFPIANVSDLRNAIQAFGRAKDKSKAAAHIVRRARALGHPELIPDAWGISKVAVRKSKPRAPRREDFTIDVPITKVDEDKYLAFGWAQMAVSKDGKMVYDKQGDFIDNIEELENAAYTFVTDSRDGGEMHVRKGVATLVESMVFTPEKIEKMGLPHNSVPLGWWVGYRVEDPGVWQAVKSGKYKMFSVHGTGQRTYVEDGE